jgi:hypothetical protein
MKKVVFSLVAFMAFSVSAFANTMEVKESSKEEKVLIVKDCYKVAQASEAAYKRAMGSSYTNSGGYAVFSAAYTACERAIK